jgi:hypothetical protein
LDPVWLHPSPSPGCFLEVLILRGLKRHVLEVLIIGDLQARLLILMDFKSFIISDLIKNEEFAQVLILGELGRAVGTEGWIFRLRECSGPPRRAGATGSECDGCGSPRLLSREDDSDLRITQRRLERRDSRSSRARLAGGGLCAKLM